MPDEPIAYEAYEQMAEVYATSIDRRAFNAYYDRPAVLSLLPDVAGLRVLDAGCGPGAYTQWLVEHGAQVVGVDASPQLLAYARQRVGDQAALHQANLNAPLDFLADQSFDLVVSALVISYLPDLNQFFTEMSRVLHPDGGFVFSTHHPMADYRRHGGSYFDTAAVSDTWGKSSGKPVDVPFYRRPLSAITGALWASGFMIERLIEPLPTAEFQQVDPEAYERLLIQPEFIAMRARRATI